MGLSASLSTLAIWMANLTLKMTKMTGTGRWHAHTLHSSECFDNGVTYVCCASTGYCWVWWI